MLLAGVTVSILVSDGGEVEHTSQCLRMADRPLATDLSGGKTSEDSFTTSMTTLAEVYTVDPKLDSDLVSLVAVLRLRMRSQGFGRLAFLAPDWVGSGTALSGVVRQVSQDEDVHVPLDSRFCKVGGVAVVEVEEPVPRSKSEMVGRDTNRPASLGSWEVSASLLALLRDR